MAVYSRISKDQLCNFLEQYNIGKLINFEGILEGIENTNYKIITSENNYILTIFEKRIKTEELPFFINLKNHLIKKNFSCPQPIANKYNNNINTLNGKSCVLISYLNGGKINKVLPHHCEQVGMVLSSLHNCTNDFHEKRMNRMNFSQWQSIFLKCKTNEFNNKFSKLIKIIEKELLYLEENWPIDLPQGIIHADIFQDNVFFINNKFSGLIDFYFACNDFLAYDIAITINAWCFDNKNKFNKDKLKSLIYGYENYRKLTKKEINYLSILLRGASIRILLTRLHDYIFHQKDAFVNPKDPYEYLEILKFHQHNNIENHLK